ncbi:hypothetical protein RXO99_29110, partial [Pseudomonas aeruginosa]|nr:hypothetical protein [Pseudomonas aeruginosa]
MAVLLQVSGKLPCLGSGSHYHALRIFYNLLSAAGHRAALILFLLYCSCCQVLEINIQVDDPTAEVGNI